MLSIEIQYSCIEITNRKCKVFILHLNCPENSIVETQKIVVVVVGSNRAI